MAASQEHGLPVGLERRDRLFEGVGPPVFELVHPVCSLSPKRLHATAPLVLMLRQAPHEALTPSPSKGGGRVAKTLSRRAFGAAA